MDYPKPVFTLSLDFELHWGKFDKVAVEEYLPFYRATIKLIPYLLDLLHSSGIRTTWATVGSLMAENYEDWLAYVPEKKAAYQGSSLCPYTWVGRTKQVSEEALFALDLVRQIAAVPGQEIGSHTFAHYYAVHGQDREAFAQDLQASQKIAFDKLGIELRSLVFPRNQFDAMAIQVAQENGFQTVRTNPKDWFWSHTEKDLLLKRLVRTGDCFLPLGKQSCYTLDHTGKTEMCCLPSSRFLKPYSGMFDNLKMKRIEGEMSQAAAQGKIYHLWFHPHNFSRYPKENLAQLGKLLGLFQRLADEKGMVSLNMGDYLHHENQGRFFSQKAFSMTSDIV